MTAPADTRTYAWRIRQGRRERLLIPVVDAAGANFSITGWTIDAKIKTRPGGTVLHTVPPGDLELSGDGFTLTLIIPAPVSEAWTWRTGWYRVKVTDPASDPADPTVERPIEGPVTVDPD